MATLYHYKHVPSELYLIHPFNGKPRKVSCKPIAQRLFAELDYEPGIKQTRQGDRIPTDLMWALWQVGLIFTGDEGEQDPTIGRVLEDTGETVPLKGEDLDTLREFIKSYTGQSRRDLEDVAESLGLSLYRDEMTPTTSTPFSDQDQSSDIGHSGDRAINDEMLEMRLEVSGVLDYTSVEAFKDWYMRKVTGPDLGKFVSSIYGASLASYEITRALTFLAQRKEISSVEITGAQDSGENVIITATLPPAVFPSEGNATLDRIQVSTGDYLLPADEHLTGRWDNDFPFVDWMINSSWAVETGATLNLTTMFTVYPSGISTVHSDVFGGSGHPEEEFAVRCHQTELIRSVLQQHIESNGPFSLPESRSYTEYICAVDFLEESQGGTQPISS